MMLYLNKTLVSGNIFPSFWDDCTCLLHISVSRDYFLSFGDFILWRICLLSPFVGGDETNGLYTSVILIRILFRYEHCTIMDEPILILVVQKR